MRLNSLALAIFSCSSFYSYSACYDRVEYQVDVAHCTYEWIADVETDNTYFYDKTFDNQSYCPSKNQFRITRTTSTSFNFNIKSPNGMWTGLEPGDYVYEMLASIYPDYVPEYNMQNWPVKHTVYRTDTLYNEQILSETRYRIEPIPCPNPPGTPTDH